LIFVSLGLTKITAFSHRQNYSMPNQKNQRSHMLREIPPTCQQVDELVEIITGPDQRYDKQTRALRTLEEIAGRRATRVALGVPLRPETIPEFEKLR
jgi:hypothetical protein